MWQDKVYSDYDDWSYTWYTKWSSSDRAWLMYFDSDFDPEGIISFATDRHHGYPIRPIK